VIANDPLRYEDKSMPNERIRQFATWLNSFRKEDFKTLEPETVRALNTIAVDSTKIAESLSPEEVGLAELPPDAEEDETV